MSLEYANLSNEVIVPKFSIDEYTLNRNIHEVGSLLKDARLLALEREQYALLGIIDMIVGKFNLIVKNVEPIQHKQKEQPHAL